MGTQGTEESPPSQIGGLNAAVVGALMTETVRRRNGPMLGTQIAAIVRSFHPDFSYERFGVTKLREFMRVHVPELVFVGTQGYDLLYDLRERAQPQPAIAPGHGSGMSLEESVWRAYCSPNSPTVLAIQVNAETTEWRTGLPNAPSTGLWRTIQPLASEKHHALASAFTETLPDATLRRSLEVALEEGVNWWVVFRDTLSQHAEDYRRFSEFRAARVQAELTQALVDAGVAAPLAGGAVQRIRASAESFRRPRLEPRRVPPVPSGDLRALVLAVIQRMPESEIRELRLRMGDVYDVLQGSR